MSSAAATQNGCKVCAPLGACMAIRGIEGAVPFLHGSQGCATYIRRYLISHFKEPVDIASSSFDESSAVFGGERNLLAGIENVRTKYQPSLIGIATTCLAETMGEDVSLYLSKYAKANSNGGGVRTFHVSTPSYAGTQTEGFWATLGALARLAKGGPAGDHITIFPGMLSPSDFRYLKEVVADFAITGHVIPDYSDTLDGPVWREYHPIPEGGTPMPHIEAMGRAAATIELTHTLTDQESPAHYLETEHGVARETLPLPIGVRSTDRLMETLAIHAGNPCPARHTDERMRLIDAYVDGHKYVSGKRAAVYGDQDLVVGMAGFLAEIGIRPVVCASGASTGRLETAIRRVVEDERFLPEVVAEDADFVEIESLANVHSPDLLVGSSKGVGAAARLGVPLIRVGFPIHDRFGGARVLHIGYRGAMQLYDRIVNALIEVKQKTNPVGYTYM